MKSIIKSIQHNSINNIIQRLIFLLLITIISSSNNIISNIKQDNKVHNVILKSYTRIAGCGYMKIAGAYVFSIEKNDSIFVGVIRCPEHYGDNFFKEGNKYKVKYTDVSISDSLKGYTIEPRFEHRSPYYLITEIKKV